MHHPALIAMLAVSMCGCSNGRQSESPHFVTEQDARLIWIAREAASAEGFSLADAIYQVCRDGDGWIVQVDQAPGYTGSGEPSVVLHGTFFVKLSSDEQVREILSHGRMIEFATRPTPQ